MFVIRSCVLAVSTSVDFENRKKSVTHSSFNWYSSIVVYLSPCAAPRTMTRKGYKRPRMLCTSRRLTRYDSFVRIFRDLAGLASRWHRRPSSVSENCAMPSDLGTFVIWTDSETVDLSPERVPATAIKTTTIIIISNTAHTVEKIYS